MAHAVHAVADRNAHLLALLRVERVVDAEPGGPHLLARRLHLRVHLLAQLVAQLRVLLQVDPGLVDFGAQRCARLRALRPHCLERIALRALGLVPQLFLLRVEVELLVQPFETAHRSHAFGVRSARSVRHLRPARAREKGGSRKQPGIQCMTCTHLSLLECVGNSATIFARIRFPTIAGSGISLQIVSAGAESQCKSRAWPLRASIGTYLRTFSCVASRITCGAMPAL